MATSTSLARSATTEDTPRTILSWRATVSEGVAAMIGALGRHKASKVAE